MAAKIEFMDLIESLVKDPDQFILQVTNDPSLLEMKYAGTESLLGFVATEGYVDAISILVNLGADINYQDDLLETPLHEAILSQNRDCVKELLSLGADTTLENLAQCNALQWAIFLGVDQNIVEAISQYSTKS